MTFISFQIGTEGPGGSMSLVVGLPTNSYKPITNMAWIRTRLCKLQKGCTRLAATSDKVYQLLAHGQWFTPASSTTKTGRHDIAEILLKVVLSTKNQIKSNPALSKSLLVIRWLKYC
jgi:hypothetical protein